MRMIGNRVLPTRWLTFVLTLSAVDIIWLGFSELATPRASLSPFIKAEEKVIE